MNLQQGMTMETPDLVALEHWASSFEELDLQIARLARLCQVKILDSDVIDRVLHGDQTVCGAENALAFAKLRGLLGMYFAVRSKAGAALGQAQAAQVETFVVERLKGTFPDIDIRWPRARA